MFVRFKSLTTEGFRAFALKQTFLLDRPAGVYLLTGVNEVDPDLEGNGVGKSTLPGDALSWLLFGKTVRGVHGPPLVSWFPHDQTYVDSKIEIDDEPTTIKRTQSPNSLLLNDKEVVNEDITRLIRITYDQALVSVILGQLSISFLDFTPKAKLELLSSILGLDLWENCSDTATRQNELLLKKIQKLETEEQSLKDQAIQLDETIKRTKEHSLQFADEQRQKIKDIHLEIRNAAERLQKLQTQTTKPEISKAETELTQLDKKITDETGCLEQLKQTTNQTALAKQKIESERSRLTKQYEKWSNLSDRCPYCNQVVPHQMIQKTKADIAKERGQCRSEYERLRKEEEDQRSNITTKQEFVNALKQDKKTKEQDFLSLKNQETELDKQILEARIQVDHLKESLGTAASTINPYVGQITEYEASLKELQEKTSSVKEGISKTLIEQKKVGWWVKGFKDLRLWITKLALDALNIIANQTLVRLGLTKWALEFDIERQTAKGTTSRGLNVTVKNQLTNERWPIEVWSGGELQRLKIGTAWGLAFLVESYSGFRCNILLLDEPSIYLSPTGLNQLLEFLHDEAHQTNKAIYVIDHHSLESPFFDGTIELVKTSHGTTISNSN